MAEKLKVTFENATCIFISKAAFKRYFDEDSDVKVETVKDEEIGMNNSERRLHNLSFKSLVGALDAKWGHTYEDTTAPAQPILSPEMQEYMDNLTNIDKHRDVDLDEYMQEEEDRLYEE